MVEVVGILTIVFCVVTVLGLGYLFSFLAPSWWYNYTFERILLGLSFAFIIAISLILLVLLIRASSDIGYFTLNLL